MSQDKLVNAIIDLHQELTGLRKDTNEQFKELHGQVQELNESVLDLRNQQAKTNLLVSENTLAIMKLAEKIEDDLK